MRNRTPFHPSRVVFSLALLLPALACAGEDPPRPAASSPPFPSVAGAALSTECAAAFGLLLQGEEGRAYEAFQANLKSQPQEGANPLALGCQEALRGNSQAALVQLARAAELLKGQPLGELALRLLAEALPQCQDPRPALEVLSRLMAEAPPTGGGSSARPYLRDLARRTQMRWLLDRGDFSGARSAALALQYIGSWALVGPFDNRDKAGFEVDYEPEHEIQFERPVAGRNRKVSWIFPEAAPLDGVVSLGEIFLPNTHAIAYGVSHLFVEQSQWAVLQVGAAGALKVWVNDRLVLKSEGYHDFAPDRETLPVYLYQGPNRILVKAAVVEEGDWAFSVRFSRMAGGPLPGFRVACGPDAVKAYAQAGAGRQAPILEPQEADLGLLPLLDTGLRADPRSTWTRIWYAFLLDRLKRGDKESPPAVRELVRAVEEAPKCPLASLLLAHVSDDVNQARIVAERCLKDHPHLPGPYAFLAGHAYRSGLDLATEQYALQAIRQFGLARAGEAAVYLAYVLQEREHRAEAQRLIGQYLEAVPHQPEAWRLLLSLEPTQSGKRGILKRALAVCGGDLQLQREWAEILTVEEQEAEAARQLTATLEARPFEISALLEVRQAWRRAGDQVQARRFLERAFQCAPENPQVLNILGSEALQAKRLDEARKWWNQLLQVKPNSPEIKDQLAELGAGSGVDRTFFEPYEIKLESLRIPKPEEHPLDNAVYLLKQEVVQVSPNGTASRMVRTIGKVLRPGGKQVLQAHDVYYDPGRQTVDVLKAAIFTPDGRELSRAHVNDRTVSALMGVQTKIYDEYHLKQIYFSDLEVGTIVDLQYVIRDSGDNIYGDYFADIFYLGDQEPVSRSQFILDLPKSRLFQTKTFHHTAQPERLASRDPEREVFKWEARDQPGVAQERDMPPAIDQFPFVQATTMKSWQEVGTWFWNLAKDQLDGSDEMRALVARITAGKASPTEKLRAIHDWVIREIRYLGIEFGRNGFKPHRATQTFKALYGDCKDTATLITTMLKFADIESRLVLVRTVDAGRIEADCLPAPNLFNHCIAYVPSVEGKDYWIDCTTDFHQLGEVPWADQGAQVLVAGPEGGRLVQIPVGTSAENRIEQQVIAKVDPAGSGIVSLREVWRGQEAASYREAAATPGQFRRFLEGRGERRFPGAKLGRLSHAQAQDLGPMWVETEFEVPKLALPSGDRWALNSTLEPLALSLRYLGAEERKHDLELWFPRARTYRIEFRLDPGYEVAALPEAAQLTEPFGYFKREVRQEGKVIVLQDDFAFTNQRIPKDQFKLFHAFCRKVDALQEQRILIKK